MANAVAGRIGEKTIVDVLGVKDGLRLREGEPLGIFFPVHGWRPPKLLSSILSGLEITGYSAASNYVYSVCTAGDTVGEAMRYLAADLRKLGMTLNAVFDVQMPNTYVGLPFMDVDSQELVDRKLGRMGLRVRDVAEKVSSGYTGIDLQIEGSWPRINSRVLGWLFAARLVTDKRFHADRAKCVGCGICERKCPAHNIIMSSHGIPEWRHNKKCMTCFACYHNCPKHAIRYGWMTLGKGQYRLPQRQG